MVKRIKISTHGTAQRMHKVFQFIDNENKLCATCYSRSHMTKDCAIHKTLQKS